MSEYPDGKKYIGLAYNKTTATESNNASDYIWSLIQGEDAVLYEIEPSVAVIKKCTLDVCSITDAFVNRIVDEQCRFLFHRTKSHLRPINKSEVKLVPHMHVGLLSKSL